MSGIPFHLTGEFSNSVGQFFDPITTPCYFISVMWHNLGYSTNNEDGSYLRRASKCLTDSDVLKL